MKKLFTLIALAALLTAWPAAARENAARSFTIQLQNMLASDLVVEDAQLTAGQWEESEPTPGQVVSPQMAQKWVNVGPNALAGLGGSVILSDAGQSSGQVTIQWAMPPDQEPRLSARVAGEGLTCDRELIGEGQHRIALITIDGK